MYLTIRKRLLIVSFVFFLVALFFFIVSPVKNHSDEIGFKETALAYAIRGMFDLQKPFHFSNDVRLTYGLDRGETVPYEQLIQTRRNSWNFYPWLILSVLFIPILSVWGDKTDRRLCVFYMLLWFLSLCWFFGSMMMIVATYSEILFTAPRMLYLFSYIIIGSGLYCLMRMRYGPFIIVAFGVAFGGWWTLGVPMVKQFSLVAPILMVVPFSAIPRLLHKDTQRCTLNATVVAVTVFLFFLPSTGKTYLEMIKRVFVSRPPVEWVTKSPFGISERSIRHFMSLSPGQRILVDPFGKDCVSVYAPQYMAIVPEIMGTTLVDMLPVYREFRQGRPWVDWSADYAFVHDKERGEVIIKK